MVYEVLLLAVREAELFQSCCVFFITARQYGEVVLPDDSTGQSPGTLAANLSRCKEGMACVFAVMVQILLRAGAIAVQTISEPVIYHGAGFKLRADERIRVREHYEFVSKAGAKAKTVTNNLPILSVLGGRSRFTIKFILR
jgi:hypothetical protein